ncbi:MULTISPECIES: type II toxin-antitoxin system VapC family toxin [Acidithiobacillus]|uniref:type II toxin-antitoxin system tRNA(fMet)-specific endonuclease VapC n=1 Tax=Acidithiobacillus TaxID=119977 RepID=UPI001C0735E4|nr:MULTISPECIES: type II toxin-antitoxin system VapC family toxin [Acidithiobacillus]MBU2854945.1 type II toxin-antitoxin system VapC family toxin [Acidithiobacillus ferriphilus]MDA8246044.1 type II toxin-antitoxin system VapC family toxin [Acidithiobacillus sp.]
MSQGYLLDTNICIYITKHHPPEVRARFAQHRAAELGMSVVTFGELMYGAEKSQARDKALKVLDQLRSSIQVLEMPVVAGQHYGQIRARLEKMGKPIGNNDLWIAAHALSEDRVLVTNNTQEFSRVEGLQLENWVS